MGCGASVNKDGKDATSDASKMSVSSAKKEFDSPPFRMTINPKNSMVNLDVSDGLVSFPIDGKTLEYTASYCYVCQKGYYPDQMNKANQDSYLVLQSLLEDKNCHVFGIFDGHGEFGDYCSYFAADNFGYCLARELKANGGTIAFEGNNMNKIYTNAFLKTNRLLKNSNVDDSLSGTTGITITLKDDTLYIGNVGDSRAIVASETSDGSMKATGLSSDQTPFRKDERERLKLRGARIFTIDQIEGHEPIHENWGTETGEEIDDAASDPPRVWDKTLEKPGCAFTRSIGDSVAETIGVFAEPEVLVWHLQPSDKFAVVASDGVFEFIPNQSVVDMMMQFSDPMEGAQHVVAEAYRLWLQNDERTDDITMIVVLFEDMKVKSGAKVVPNDANEQARDKSKSEKQARPVRTVASKARRKDISEAFDSSNDPEFDFEANATPKTPDELARIGHHLKSNFMFQHLQASQRDQIFQVMKLRDVKADELIIKEGDAGDEMYIVDEGEFDVLKLNDAGEEKKVHQYTSAGSAFGDLSLMYGKPRAATIKAKTDGKLWCIGRLAFRAVVMKKNDLNLIHTFRSVPPFKELNYTILQRLCMAAALEDHVDGELVAERSSSTDVPPQWAVTVILSGSLEIEPIAQPGDVQQSPRQHTRESGAFLTASEIGLTVQKVKAKGKCKLAYIDNATFTELCGPDALQELELSVSSPKFRGKALKRKGSFLSDEKKRALAPMKAKFEDFSREQTTMSPGDFAYIGTFNHKAGDGDTFSAKVIGKAIAASQKMDARLLQERNILAAISNDNKCKTIVKLKNVCQNEKVGNESILVIYYLLTIALAFTNLLLSFLNNQLFI